MTVSAFSIILGLVYLAVGVAKLLGVERVANQFEDFGLDRRALAAVGALEVAAAIGLQFEGLRTLAALGMILMTIGALTSHARAEHEMELFVPAIVVLAGSIAFFAWTL